MDFSKVDINTVISTLVAVAPIVIGAIWALIEFVSGRKRETQLKRTEYVFQLWQSFHNDKQIIEAISILEGRHPTRTIDEFCRVARIDGPMTQDDLQLYQTVEHLLSFLWTLAYTHFHLKSLKATDLQVFGYWLDRVGSNAIVQAYCTEFGYDEILRANDKLPKLPTWKPRVVWFRRILSRTRPAATQP